MNDPEFILLRNKFLLGIAITIIFAIPIFFIIKNKILNEDTSIIKSFQEESRILLFLEDNNCKNCKEYKNILSDSNVYYYSLNKSKDKEYKKTLNILKISQEDINIPSLLYVEKGNLVATLVDIDTKEEIIEFIKNYNLTN